MGFSHRLSHGLAALALVLVLASSHAQEVAAPLPSGTFPPDKAREQGIGEVSAGSEVAAVAFSKNHFAWVEKLAGKRTVFRDAKPVGVYDDTGWLRFSRDEQHLIFIAKRDSKWFVVLDGEVKSPAYGKLTGAVLSPDGRSYAVGACNQKQCRLVVNSEEIGPEFEDISAPRFSPEGDRYAYFGYRGKRWVLMLDGKESGPPMDDFARFWFSADGKRVAVAALLNHRWAWVVDGVPGAGLEAVSGSSTSRISSSWPATVSACCGSPCLASSCHQYFPGAGVGGPACAAKAVVASR